MLTRRLTIGLALLLVSGLAAACTDATTEPHGEVLPGFAEKPRAREAVDPLDVKFPVGPVQAEDTTVVSETPIEETDTVLNKITTTRWIERKVRYSARDNPEQFMQVNPNADVLWPGNVVLGTTIADGSPSDFPIAGNRRPVSVYLTVVSGDSSGVANRLYREVAEPTGASVHHAMNEILAGYKGSAPARFTYSSEAAYNASQVAFKLGFGYSGPAVTLDADFGFSNKKATSRYTVRLMQEYYTMAVVPFYGLGGAWDTTAVRIADVSRFVSPSSPVAYISSVTYGRAYWLTYESTASETELEAAVNAAYSGGVVSGDLNAEAMFKEVMTKTKVRLTQIGGDASAGLETLDGTNFNSIRKFMAAGARFSPSSPGAVISYKVRYLSDGQLMKLGTTMDYTVTERVPAGSASSVTSSRFNFDIVSDESWGSIVSSRGAIIVRVLDINQKDGTQRQLWRSPCDVNCDGRRDAFGIKYVPWNRYDVDPEYLGWTVPEIQMPNEYGHLVALECITVNFEEWAKPVYGIDRRVYKYNEGTNLWELTDKTKNARWCQATDTKREVTAGINYMLHINGELQQ
jgi:hypothetical protein